MCYDRDSGEPVGAWIGRVSLPTETPAPTTSAQAAGGTATRTSSETRWTLQEADAASYLTIATRVTSSYSNQMEAACYGEIAITNSLNEFVVGECEDYSTLYDEGAGHRRISRIAFHGPETLTHYAGWRTSTLGYETEYYLIRCVAYRISDAQGYPIPGRWISEAYPENGSLLESGLTIITVPNPCAR